MIFILLFLTSFIFQDHVSASVYLDEEAAQEGLKRGQSEPFVSSTGIILGDTEDKKRAIFNGVLIHPSMVLAPKHSFTSCKIKDGSFCVAPDVKAFWDEMGSSGETRKEELRTLGSQLDLRKIYTHPDENVDLAIVRLKHPLATTKILPLYPTKPKGKFNGYLVSYAPVYTSPESEAVYAEYKRHIAILDVQEENIAFLDVEEKNLRTPLLVTEWKLKGNIHDPQNHFFVPQEGMHRLTAFSQRRDSGASFIAKNQGILYLAGIHKGRVGAKEEENRTATYTTIVPLYPHITWIEEVIKNFENSFNNQQK